MVSLWDRKEGCTITENFYFLSKSLILYNSLPESELFDCLFGQGFNLSMTTMSGLELLISDPRHNGVSLG